MGSYCSKVKGSYSSKAQKIKGSHCSMVMGSYCSKVKVVMGRKAKIDSMAKVGQENQRLEHWLQPMNHRTIQV